MKEAWVYILECSDGSLYTGSTSDIERRLAEHRKGILGGYTATRRPCKLVFVQHFPDVSEAVRAERQIKGWTRAKKLALVSGDFELVRVLSRCRNATRHDRDRAGEER